MMEVDYAAQAEIENVVAKLTAYHEAGHAVMAFTSKIRVDEVSMVGRGKTIASVRSGASATSSEEVDFAIECVITLSGMEAARMYAEREGLDKRFTGLDDHIQAAGRGDIMDFNARMKEAGFTETREREEMTAWLEGMTRRSIEKDWSAVEAVAFALLKEYRLDEARLTAIMEAA